jgi:hypothetical protein
MILIVNKMRKKLEIINYKKWIVNIIFKGEIKKKLLETHHHFIVDTTPPLERAHRDGFSITVKGCMTTRART